ncbi:Fe-S oxidoreductase [Candidatus Scalindua japonica]|uniref:Fe-S oxidoreductase n=2 Tax=Candidatus Scalindua japonica TaxID=1284222 RepID=A0A286TTE3_9BACT|nr:Fe-S oxidoreductase [Candidatus Scalindua japonica]
MRGFNKLIFNAPLALGYIAALTPSHWKIEVLDEQEINFENSIDRLSEYSNVDLVGITALTVTAPRAYEIAAFFKKRKIPVVMGGIHVSMMPDEALNFADCVVIGEPDSIWNDLIKDAENGNLKKKYTGEYLPLGGLVKPRRDIFGDYKAATVQTSRGCPMSCEFCSTVAFNGRVYRQRPVNDILDELESIPQKMTYFIDDNLIGHNKKDEERIISLCKGMIERKINKMWWCQATMSFGNNEELLYYARKSGCVCVLLGIESISEKVLRRMNKELNLKLDYRETINRIHKSGILVLGNILVGNDDDTKEVIEENIQFFKEVNIDAPGHVFVTPLPGTKFFERLDAENRIVNKNFPKDWKYYDLLHLVIKPNALSQKEIIDLKLLFYNNLFSYRQIIIRAFKSLIYSKKLYIGIGALLMNLWYRKFFHRYDSLIKEDE